MKMDESSTVLTQFEANSDLVINKCELIDVAEKSQEICLKLPAVKTTENIAEDEQQSDLKTANTNNNLPVSADSDNKQGVINEENERNSAQQEVLELPEEVASNKSPVEQVEVNSEKEKDDESLTVGVSKLVDLIENDEVEKIVDENDVDEVLEDEVVEEEVEEVTEEAQEVTEEVQEVTDDVQEITENVKEEKGMNVDQEIDNEIEELDQEVNKMTDVDKDMTEVDQEVTEVDQNVTEVTEVDKTVTEVEQEIVEQEVTDDVDQEVTDDDQKVTDLDQEVTDDDQKVTDLDQEVTDDVDQEVTDDVDQEVTDDVRQEVTDVDQDIADVKEEIADCQEVTEVQELVAEVKEEVVDVVEGVQTEETDESLNRMHVMDEGCDEAQPSSPGHAEQRPHDNNEELPLKLPTITITNLKPLLENGNSEQVKPIPTTNGINSHSYTKDIEEDLQEVVIIKSRNREGLPVVQSTKRKGVALLEETATETKKLKTNLVEQFDDFTVRDNVLTNYLDGMDCSTVDRIKSQSELLLREIQKLGDLAIVKEREWNQILHMKKLKEELLLRLQRSKQILLLNNGLEISADSNQTGGEHERKTKGRLLMRNTSPPSSTYEADLRSRNRQVLDVQKVIADYRQSHPETVPRRGRRIRTSLPPQESGTRYANEGGVLTFSNLALGSGSQVRTNLSIPSDVYSEFSTLLNNMDSERLRSASSASIKELLAQFSKMSQAERQELLQSVVKQPTPPPYPEVTVHPVVTLPDITVNSQQSNNGTTTGNNSLLHGILTKTPAKPTTTDSKSSFSPTLARLLTAPERVFANNTGRVHGKHQLDQQSQQQQQPVNMSSDHQHHHQNPTSIIGSSNVSLSAILSSSKTRNEITITPVAQFDEKDTTTSIADEDMEDNSADRLVIDEGGDTDNIKHKQSAGVVVVTSNDNVSDSGDEVPQCQGCHQKAAQFVCAGCGNQWYCSRDCQVNAWDEHSELCSG